MALALSSVEDVADQLGIEPAIADQSRLERALAVGREQITAMVVPVAELPDPLPESLHEACAIRAAAEFASRQQRYGYQPDPEEGPGPPPAKYLVRDLVEPWARPKGGRGPDPRHQQW